MTSYLMFNAYPYALKKTSPHPVFMLSYLMFNAYPYALKKQHFTSSRVYAELLDV